MPAKKKPRPHAARPSSDIGALALSLANCGAEDAADVLRQAEGRQRLAAKVPSWTAVEGLRYPPRLALEQCSGEVAARYKAEVVRRLLPDGGAMADLTGGFGVDFSFIAPLFSRAIYVERQAELCDLARHNFPLLGLKNAEIIEGNGTSQLEILPSLDLLFLDPARRDGAGRKTVLIEDCEPDVARLLPQLQAKARFTLVKLSPMLDVHRAVETLGCVEEVHVVADGGECKDLLLVLGREAVASPMLHVAEGPLRLSLNLADEAAAQPRYAAAPAAYLYEPGPAVMKAGVFKWVAVHYGLEKLHPNSHLYTSAALVPDFPGRTFRVRAVSGFSKKELRDLRATTDRANLTVRNFPTSVGELRQRLKVKEGGEAYWFATTLCDGTHRLIDCRKIAAEDR